jgi:methionyl-tRNA formyltransferase
VKLAFAGAPQFGAWVLADLLDSDRVPSLVISQPDRPAGRGRNLSAPPVAALAADRGLACVQPDSINDPALVERLKEEGVEVLVVAAFGQLLRAVVLESFHCVNVHASLLPAWRGAAPIARSLMAGEFTTGVSIMRMTAGLDEGPYALQISRSVGLEEDAGSLARSLALLGAQGVDHVLAALEYGTVRWTEQRGEPSYAAKLTADERLLDPTDTALGCHNLVRSLAPAIGVEAVLGSLQVKVWRTWPWLAGEEALAAGAAAAVDRPGTLVRRRDRLFIGCTSGVLELLLVQPQGKRPMTVPAFLRGYGSRLGEVMTIRPRGDL